MSSHPWENDVLGGVGVPRILTCSQNKCTNPYFDQDETGWTESGGLAGRVANDDGWSGYMYEVDEGEQGDYVQFSWNTGAAIAGRTFVAGVRVKGNWASTNEVAMSLRGTGEFGTKDMVLQEDTLNRNILIATSGASQGNSLVLRLSGFSDADTSLKYWFDNVFMCEVFGDYSFTQPNELSRLRFQKIVRGNNEIISGHIQEFNKYWRPHYYASWKYLDDVIEAFRQEISEEEILFCMPHTDVNWGFFGIWDGDFLRQYSFNKFFGHKGIVAIKGIEMLKEKPQYYTGEGTVYIDSEDMIY